MRLLRASGWLLAGFGGFVAVAIASAWLAYWLGTSTVAVVALVGVAATLTAGTRVTVDIRKHSR